MFLALISCAPYSAAAQVLTPFRYEYQAQRHCPGDSIVWLDFGRERYYLKGQRRYASGYTAASYAGMRPGIAAIGARPWD